LFLFGTNIAKKSFGHIVVSIQIGIMRFGLCVV